MTDHRIDRFARLLSRRGLLGTALGGAGLALSGRAAGAAWYGGTCSHDHQCAREYAGAVCCPGRPGNKGTCVACNGPRRRVRPLDCACCRTDTGVCTCRDGRTVRPGQRC